MKLLKYNIPLIAAILLMISCAQDGEKDRTSMTRPNIILVITDDQGYGDLGCHGNELIRTPNLDKWSQRSVRFTNFHVATTCAPTRSGLMSGMHCNRVGAWHTILGRSFLSDRYPTMANFLSGAGYQTGIFGKWHLGDNYPFRPQDRGFDEVLIHGGGGVGQTPDYWNNDYFDDTYLHNGKPEKFTGYCTDIWFDEAIEFMKKASSESEPFFCYLTTNAPHGPFHVPQKYIDLYEGNENIPNPNFYGMITNVDENIGKLENALEQFGLKENTVLIYLTDNGTAAGANLDADRHVIKGFNAGMRGKKGSEYEGGHRVPLFMQFPTAMGITQRIFGQLITYTDILPTILDLIDIPIEDTLSFDGTSFGPLLRNGKQQALEDRIIIVDTQREEWPTKWKNASVMQNNWRLINNKELYNLASDPAQRQNQIEDHPDLANRLASAYELWWQDIEPDFHHENRMIIGSAKENPSMLTCHDWHSDQHPPWNQGHIRRALINNGHWLLDIERAGEYQIRLHRWPPYLPNKMDEDVEIGDQIPGGEPYDIGLGLAVKRAKLKVQGKEQTSTEITTGQYFDFQVLLEEGPAQLQTWLTDDQEVERGAYYVELERMTK